MRPRLIAVCGVSGAGKSTVVSALAARYAHSTAIYWDDYDDSSVSPEDYVAWYAESKSYVDWKRPQLAHCLDRLKGGQDADCLASGRLLKAMPLLFFDAPLGLLHEETGSFIDLLFFLDLPPDLSLIRRFKRDYLREDSISTATLRKELELYEKHTRPLFVETDDLAKGADVVIDARREVGEIVGVMSRWLDRLALV